MAVPDTTTFTLQNVVDEISPTTDDLVDCIADAQESKYDPDYFTTPATNLLEFRNYGINVWTIADIVSGTTADVTSLINGATYPGAVQPTIDPGGTRLYIPEGANQKIRQISIATANDLSSTLGDVGLSSALSYLVISIQISSDGTKMIILDDPNDSIREYALSTAWDITSMSTTATTSISVPTPNTTSRNLAFSFDGKRMFMIQFDGTTRYLIEWALSAGWDLSTAGSATSNDITSTVGGAASGLFYIEETGTPILIHTAGYGGDAYINGVNNAAWDHFNATATYIVYGSTNDSDHMYTLNRSGVNPNYVWTLTQWDTNV